MYEHEFQPIKDFFTDTCDAIREVEGSAESIPHADIPDRIRGLQIGGASGIYTVQINESDSNPFTCCTYADDALLYPTESEKWDKLFGYRPCLFKNGEVVGYLNPNDFTKFEDGQPADITTGASGDVMIEFPMFGFKFERTENFLNVSLTRKRYMDGFVYYPFETNSEIKDKMYIGAYAGSVDTTLNSLSGKQITTNRTITDFRNMANAKGDGYGIISFYALQLIQAMFILKHKNISSVLVFGQGKNDGVAGTTGTLDSSGMNVKNFQRKNIKLFGLEDFWGQVNYFTDGVCLDENGNYLVSSKKFDDFSQYKNIGRSPLSAPYARFPSKCVGTSDGCFLPTEMNGSSSTFFAENTYAYYPFREKCAAGFSSNQTINQNYAMLLNFNFSFSDVHALASSRLMYL